jgi:hypothetical protein
MVNENRWLFSNKNINKQNIKKSCLLVICFEKGFSTHSSEFWLQLHFNITFVINCAVPSKCKLNVILTKIH